MVDITAAEVYRDFVTDGVPSSGKNDPHKRDIRKLLKQYETIIAAFTASGGVIYASKAALDADLARPANTMAWVLGDAVAANNGIYRKVGASGAGNWVRAGDLPYSFILASNVGAGTPSAIQATTSIPVSGSALILLQIAEDYTGEIATVSFNDGSPLIVKSNSGNDISPGGLVSGMIVAGVISGNTFRIVTDQVSSAIVAAAEAWASQSKDARDIAVAAAAGVTLPLAVANTYLRQAADLSGYEPVTAAQVREDLDPDSKVLVGQGLLSVVYKASSARHIKSYGAEGTVGVGNASADTAALQVALNSGNIVDITGATLHVNAKIIVNTARANLVSHTAARVGAGATSRIIVDVDTLDKLFEVKQPNFEASGFYIECGASNATTTLFHFERAAGSASDIDAALRSITHEGGGKLFHIYGRGLKLQDITSGNVKICVGDLDWPASWTPNGLSNDTQETGFRAFEFRGIRMHGAALGIRNIGTNAANLGSFQGSDWEADIGSGAMWSGIATRHVQITNIMGNIGATIAGCILDLADGSNGATFMNLKCVGIKGTVTRLNRNAIILRPGAIGIRNIQIKGGMIGPLNRSGIDIVGFGAVQNLLIDGINFDRTGIEAAQYSPIRLIESGGTFSDVSIKLLGCNFDFGSEIAPNYIVGGVNSAAINLIRDVGTTKPSAVPWAQSNAVQTYAAVA